MSPATSNELPAAVVGYGRFGRFHAAKYVSMPGVVLAGIVEPDAERRALANREISSTPTFRSIDELLSKVTPAIASIVVPATLHYPIARSCLEAGVHVLVEKPLCSNLKEAQQLIHIAGQQRLILQPGYIERFNDAVSALCAEVPQSRYIEARRLTWWSGRGGDVNVVMDLMTHDIDLLMELVDAPIASVQARGMKVVTEHWDVVEARFQFTDGCAATLAASRASERTQRSLLVSSESTSVLVNKTEGVIELCRIGANGITIDRRRVEQVDPLSAEIAEFIAAVRESRSPRVTTADGYRAIEIAQQVVAAMKESPSLLDRIGMPMTNSGDISMPLNPVPARPDSAS